MNKTRYLLGLLAIGAFVLGACATDATEAPADVPEEEPVAQVDPANCNLTAPSSATEVNVIGWSFEIMNFYAEEMEKCSEVENLEVNVQLQDFVATREAFNLAMTGGDESPFDIMHVSNPELNEFGNNGWLLPLNDLIDKYRDEYDLDDIADVSWEGATIDGVIYGIPATANTLHLAYRADVLEEYGLEVPTTYDEIIEMCGVLADAPGIDLPFTNDVSAGWAWEIEFLAFIRSFGSDYLNADSTVAFNGPEGVAAATKMKEVVDACMPPSGLQSYYEETEVNLNTGTQAMVHIWASNTVSMFDPEQSDFADVVAFAPAAAPKPGGLLGGSAWHDFYTIPATTPTDTDLIFRILMESLDRTSMLGAADLGIVTRSSIDKGLPNLAAASETIANGVGIYDPNPATSLAQAALWNWMPFIGTGEMTPQEALDAAAEEYTAEATAQGYLP